MTEDAKSILNQLKEHAANMSYLNALMTAFMESTPFSTELDQAKRYHALQCYAGICDLAAYYSEIVHRDIDLHCKRM